MPRLYPYLVRKSAQMVLFHLIRRLAAPSESKFNLQEVVGLALALLDQLKGFWNRCRFNIGWQTSYSEGESRISKRMSKTSKFRVFREIESMDWLSI